jgi:hypothetical protein
MLDVQRSAPTARARYASATTPRVFYLAMSLLMLALVTYGFSRTIVPALLKAHRPHHVLLLLSIHGVVFYGWMMLMVVQSALVLVRRIRIHRLLGWFGAADAALVVIMGLWAAFHQSPPAPFEMVGIVSMAGFGVPVSLAIRWRKRPAYHRRLLLIASAMLANAAFARFPGTYLPQHFFYLGTDLLIALGIAHDLWRDRTVHPVYRYALPLLLAAETAVMIPAWRYLS